MRIATAAALFALSILSGCQPTDVGQACTLDLNPAPQAVTADFLELGKTECENLACLQSPAGKSGSAANGTYCTQGAGGLECRAYCTKPCVSDSDCGGSGLVCRPVVGETFVKDPTLTNIPVDGGTASYVGDGRYSKCCAIPLP